MRSRSTILALAATLAVPAATYAEPLALDPTTPDRVEPREPNRFDDALFITGAVTFAASYGAAVGVAAGSLDRDERALYVPLAGPWIALAANAPCDGDCKHDTRDDVLLVLDGVAQAAGVALAVTSLLGTHDDRVQVRGAHLAITSRSVGIAARF
jgi:hypothetical protein